MTLEERIEKGYDASLVNVDGTPRERTYYTFEPSKEGRKERAGLYFRAAVSATQRTATERPWDNERISIGLAACKIAAQMVEASK